MTVEYTRKRITRTTRVEVKGDNTWGRLDTDKHWLALGYTRTMLVIEKLTICWSAAYERIEVVADTARGDEVAL